MWLIADSGSTKTEWLLHDDAVVDTVLHSAGMNPYFTSQQEMEQLLQSDIAPKLTNPVSHIFFYGAGCLAEDNKLKVKNALSKVFPFASVVVETDMTGAARALCQHDAGIACILGTGANSCVYNGKVITANGPALGYILGDEGSGAYLGKQLVKAYLQQQLPASLCTSFEKQFNLSRNTIIDAVYRKPFANRYLASFAPFISANIQDEFCKQLVKDACRLFLKNNVQILPEHRELSISFAGSVAYYFKDILIEILAEQQLKVGVIAQSVCERLLIYHKK